MVKWDFNRLSFAASRSFPNIFPKSAPTRLPIFSINLKNNFFASITLFIADSRAALSTPFTTSPKILSVKMPSVIFFRKGVIHLPYSSRTAGSLSRPFQCSGKYFYPLPITFELQYAGLYSERQARSRRILLF